jgi:hypothetical protein
LTTIPVGSCCPGTFIYGQSNEGSQRWQRARMTASVDPVLSVVVTIASDTLHEPSIDHLRQCLESLARQNNPPIMEVIVPHQPGFTAIGQLGQEFPAVRFLEVCDLNRYTGRSGSREHHNELRARGVAAARGEIVALTEDHAVFDPDWSASIVEAHGKPVEAVGGAIENAAPGLLNWAVYFREFGQYQNPVREKEAFGPSDVNASYKRSALAAIRDVWTDTFEEHTVNSAIQVSGRRTSFSSRIVVYQKRLNLDLASALKERWIWGRSYGTWRGLSGFTRFVWAGISPVLPVVLVVRAAATIARKRRNRGVFLKALPLLILITTAWCAGEMSAYLTGPKVKGRSV